jgi:hypothetical protein
VGFKNKNLIYYSRVHNNFIIILIKVMASNSLN